jgi:UDPglucose 6-dehydrogenase
MQLAKVAIIGLGYVGITTSVGLAGLGHNVVGYDIDPERVDLLANGKAPIFENGLAEALEENLGKGTLSFTNSLDTLAKSNAEFFFVCVPTPQDASGAANLSYVLDVVRQLKEIATPGSVVVLKSTVPVGSGERVRLALGRPDVHVASNPEFLREGSALRDFMFPDRIIAGASDPQVAEMVLSLYQNLDSQKLATSIESAELVKYSTNAYLATRLSFVNDLAALCEKVGASIDDVVAGLGSDSRIGTSFLSPGPGWGGSCFPKDTRALVSVASDFGVDLPLIDAALESNERAVARVVEQIRELAGGALEGKTIAVWGLAFKANTDDTRESPSLNVISRLIDRGSSIRAFDPVATHSSGQMFTQVDSALEAVKQADVLVVLTEWSEFSKVDSSEVGRLLKTQAVLDTRRILPAVAWRRNIATFHALGDPHA